MIGKESKIDYSDLDELIACNKPNYLFYNII